MPWGAAAALAGAVISAKGSRDATKSANAQNDKALAAAKMDPRIEAMLHGEADKPGLLSQYRDMLGKPQNAGINAYERSNDSYLGGAAAEDTYKLRATAHGQMNSGTTQAPQINAPGQNAVATQGSFDRFINGNAANNPYLTDSINGAMAQSTNVFGQMQGMATENLQENILPGIRSNSVLAGQYGGSRQGVAEGNAIGDFAKAQQQAINQFGQNNSNAAIGAQSQAFNQGQDRALAATTNLSGQQYGTAVTNAGLEMQQQGINDARVQTGVVNLNGLIGGAYNAGQNQDSYALNQAAKVNGLLTPHMSQSGSSPIPQPLYGGSTAGSAIGGAMAGLSIYNQFKGMGNSNTTPPPSPYGQTGPTNTNPWPT